MALWLLTSIADGVQSATPSSPTPCPRLFKDQSSTSVVKVALLLPLLQTNLSLFPFRSLNLVASEIYFISFLNLWFGETWGPLVS